MEQTRWRRPRRSDGANNCVELHPDGWLRDSKDPERWLRMPVAHVVLAAKLITERT